MTTTTGTKRGLRISAAAAVLAGTAAIQLAGAQDSAEPVNVDVSECVKLTKPEERLACFEKQVEGSRASGADSAAISSSPEPANDSSSGVGQERPEEDPPDIQARVAEMRETVPNSYLITLDNGQVWRQTVPKAYRLRPGSAVRIYLSRWGAYRLTDEQLKGFIQVERVR